MNTTDKTTMPTLEEILSKINPDTHPAGKRLKRINPQSETVIRNSPLSLMLQKYFCLKEDLKQLREEWRGTFQRKYNEVYRWKDPKENAQCPEMANDIELLNVAEANVILIDDAYWRLLLFENPTARDKHSVAVRAGWVLVCKLKNPDDEGYGVIEPILGRRLTTFTFGTPHPH